jgi:hypothetical protein
MDPNMGPSVEPTSSQSGPKLEECALTKRGPLEIHHAYALARERQAVYLYTPRVQILLTKRSPKMQDFHPFNHWMQKWHPTLQKQQQEPEQEQEQNP